MTRSALLTGLVLVVAASACEGTAPRVPAYVDVSPQHATANLIGATIPYRAQVRDAGGDVIHEADITWSTSDDDVAIVSGAGMVTVTGHGDADIVASHGSLSGSGRLEVRLTPARLVKVAGDSLTAPGLSRLAVDPAVRVEDMGGETISGVQVVFEVSPGSGEVEPRISTTDANGIASTSWTLGESEGEQSLTAYAGPLSALFSVTATEPELTIKTRELALARATLAYQEAIRITGLHEPPLEWSVTEGSPPAGIGLDSAGVLSGVAIRDGTVSFTVSVSDAAGRESSRRLALKVCEPPLDMEPGDVLVFREDLHHRECPPLLPSGQAGDQYRIAVARNSVTAGGAVGTVTLEVTAVGTDTDPAAAAPALRLSGPAPRLPPALAAVVQMVEETARYHASLFARAEVQLRQLGPRALLPDLRVRPAPGASPAAVPAPPPERIMLRPYSGGSSCNAPGPAPVPALLVGYNDHLAIYQDSLQRTSDPVRAEHATQVLDYYEKYGAETISEFFGGVSDINGDGHVTVFVSPVVPADVAGFVWPGDFLDTEDCAGSNGMELVYISESLLSALGAEPGVRHYQVFSTTVHEVKHVSSLYRRWAADDFHPTWIEEGTAEIAAEMSSRKAMEAAGGVARGAVLNRDAYPLRDGSIISPENFGMLVGLARTTASYSASVNSLTGNPSAGHSFYGTSWHFHRFLGDAYGNAAGNGEGPLFTALNDTATASGAPGIEQVTGKPVAVLVEEYVTAMMFNGTGAPQPERSFSTYDFPSATFELFRPEGQPDGLYPWPRTGPEPAPFRSTTYIGGIAAAGVRFHDFESDGTGTGIEIAVSAGFLPDLRIVIARLR